MKQKFGIIAMDSFNGKGAILDNYLKKVTGSKESFIVKSNCVRFSNGEGKVVINESIRNKTVFIISDVSNYSETYNTVYKTLCKDTPFEYELEYFDEETGACRQVFRKKAKS